MMSNEEEIDQPPLSSDMSDDNQIYAEFKDGRLHIVEVSPYDKVTEPENTMSYETEILPELTTNDGEDQTKYLQLDLLNFTVLKNADGTSTFKMLPSDGSTDNDDTTITCVLAGDDVEDEENPGSYVMLQTDDEQDPYMFLQSAETEQPEPTAETQNTEPEPTPSKSTDNSKQLTPLQILERAKAIQKAKALASPFMAKMKRGRKKKGDLPPPIELLTSPNFKLYLYSCKLCTFKCNAVKEMSAHKRSEHACLTKGPSGRPTASFQCARCPFRGQTRKHLDTHLTTHVKQKSAPRAYMTALHLDSEEVEAADILVCGACGFESGDRALFKKHIEDEHGAITA